MKTAVLLSILFLATATFAAPSESITVPKIKGKLVNLTNFHNSQIRLATQIICRAENLNGYGERCGETIGSEVTPSQDGSFVIPEANLEASGNFLRAKFDVRVTATVSGSPVFMYRLQYYHCTIANRSCGFGQLVKQLSTFTLIQIPTINIIPEFSSGRSTDEFNKRYIGGSGAGLIHVNVARKNEAFYQGNNLYRFIESVPVSTLSNYFLAVEGRVSDFDQFKLKIQVDGMSCASVTQREVVLEYSVRDGATLGGVPVSSLSWPMDDSNCK